MNDTILTTVVDSLTTVRLAQIEADKEIALAAMQMKMQTPASNVDWNAFAIVTLVIFLPILIFFCYLGYKKYLKHQRRQLNDELIVNLAHQGQTLTPEMIAAIRCDEDEKKPATAEEHSSESYQKLCTGGALLIGGAIVCLRNRAFGMIMLIIGLFVVAQGLALWLSHRNESNDSTPNNNNA